ncbi:cell death abnormality protein 1-like [Haliotis cracherodii]|uniref:cell death abnormality protein 1-like n=1 Tax=Haliotis cracherodii TaxID=6455 RepID=UPI0039EA41C7
MYQYVCLSFVIVMFLGQGYTDESVECPVGFWGAGCSEKCPEVCQDSCSTQGMCTDCTGGYFGIRCNKTCPPNCSGGRCYRFNVSCVEGCKPGWYGKKCGESCQCRSGVCERKTGHCTSAPRRVVLPKEETSTDAISKGSSCSEVTRQRCKWKRCFQDDGHWVCDGCADGFKGRQCSQNCPQGCKSCKQEGMLCIECQKGFYGRTCQKACPNCKDGCHLRYAKCQSYCVEGYFGPSCNKRCGNNCKNRTAGLGPCNQATGACTLGCEDGYYGHTCQRKCFRACTSAGKFQSCHSVCKREFKESVAETASYNGSSADFGTGHGVTYISNKVVVSVIITIVVVGFIVVFGTLNWCVLPAKRKTEREVQVIFMVPREEFPQDSTDIYNGNQTNETATMTSMLGSNEGDDQERTYLYVPPYMRSTTNHRLQLERENEHHYESLDSIHEGRRNIIIHDEHERLSAHLAQRYMDDRGHSSYV